MMSQSVAASFSCLRIFGAQRRCEILVTRPIVALQQCFRGMQQEVSVPWVD